MKKSLIIPLAILFVLSGISFSYAFEEKNAVQAYAEMLKDSTAYILDVRTPEEWNLVGHPGKNKLSEGAQLDGRVLNISYGEFKGGSFAPNHSFVKDVQQLFPDRKKRILLICRSGERSKAAAIALEAVGYGKLAHISDGFEGITDTRGYRTVNGWKVAGLPYNYIPDGAYAGN